MLSRHLGAEREIARAAAFSYTVATLSPPEISPPEYSQLIQAQLSPSSSSSSLFLTLTSSLPTRSTHSQLLIVYITPPTLTLQLTSLPSSPIITATTEHTAPHVIVTVTTPTPTATLPPLITSTTVSSPVELSSESSASMSAFALPSPSVTAFGTAPSLDTFNHKNTTSDHIGNFLLGSDWSALSSLSPSTAPVRAVAEESHLWASSAMSDIPLFPAAADNVRPLQQVTTTTMTRPSVSIPTDAPVVTSAPAISVTSDTTELALTPPHRHSFDTCYSDSCGSPDSERDFLTSPSMFDDADFDFDADNLANVPLFGDNSYEDNLDAPTEDPVDAFASNFENVKLEANDMDSQLTDASQSTVMPAQPQVKLEEDVDSFSSLEDAFNTDSPSAKSELKPEEELWSFEEMKPYFGDEETKAALLSTLAHAFGTDFSEPVKAAKAIASVSDAVAYRDEQCNSKIGPIRSARSHRERRSSPGKPSAAASPAPVIDPITKAKRWQCHECGKWFDRAYNLKTHRYTHEDPETRARPFVCPEVDCEKQFARKHDMQRHFENVHRGESRRAKGGSLKRSRADDLG